MATMADVARAAGVSRSTVSYVLSGARPISEATRERIVRVMRELDYTPNVLAQGLAGKRTGIIALLHPPGEQGLNLTEFEYIQTAAEQVRADGYHLLLWPIASTDIDEVHKVVSQGLVEGVLLMEIQPEDQRVTALVESRIPFTMIGRPSEPADLSYVDADFDAGGILAVEHLAALGHKEIAFLGRSEGFVAAISRAKEAVVAAAAQHGVELRVFMCPATIPAGREIFEEIQDTAPGVTAVIGINEGATVGLMDAAELAGMSIPGELSIVALNMSEGMAERAHPALTSVSSSSEDMARLAAKDLIRRLRGEETSMVQVLFEPRLVVRGSSGPATRRRRG
ncbi:LacI family transcriptional regulator [Arthrobacter sp. GN70]|uniref:LacI family transcriptional regulator n=2 Tax=Arthrobacter TaxID=1663 RepID=A0A4R5KAY2_9MICC|nr:LacI family transcriptional regulator [Arthrobacter sp. GN70]TDF92289.1 LacI family transcriptional regulator [Arthrobacter terricola]